MESRLIRLGARRVESRDGTVRVIKPICDDGCWRFAIYRNGALIGYVGYAAHISESIESAKERLETICRGYQEL